jgi:hypothetical protein
MKTALERIHEAYKYNDLQTAQKIHADINKKERQKEKQRLEEYRNNFNIPPVKWFDGRK